MALLPVEEALRAHSRRRRRPLRAESVDLLAARGRVLAEDVAATLTQPPFDASAMDGYAVRAADVAHGAGRARASSANRTPARRFAGTVGAGEAVRIFTGAPRARRRRRRRHPGEHRARRRHASSCARRPRPGANIRTRRRRLPRRATCCCEPAAGSMPRAITLAAAGGPRASCTVRRKPLRRHPGDRRRAGRAGHHARPRPDRLVQPLRPRRAGRARRRRARSCSASPRDTREALDAKLADGRRRRHPGHDRRRLGRRSRPRRARRSKPRHDARLLEDRHAARQAACCSGASAPCACSGCPATRSPASSRARVPGAADLPRCSGAADAPAARARRRSSPHDLEANGPRQHYMRATLDSRAARACPASRAVLAGQRPHVGAGGRRRADRAPARCARRARAGETVPRSPPRLLTSRICGPSCGTLARTARVRSCFVQTT